MLRIRLTREILLPDPVKLARFEKSPELGPKILFFSGGMALRNLSRTIIRYSHNTIHIITTFDSGGSSAKLRAAFGMPSIGDVRNRLMALADQSLHGNREIFDLFAHRFPENGDHRELKEELERMARGRHPMVSRIHDPMRKIIRHHLTLFLERMPAGFDLQGANIGNLVLTAGYLANHRHLDPVIYIFSKLVQVCGVVRPVINLNLHLVADMEDGEVIFGQHRLAGKEFPPIEKRVKRLRLARNSTEIEPYRPPLRNKTRDLIAKAELICFPMGSFYSSLVANLLPAGVGKAVSVNRCPKVFIPNLGTDPEAYGLTVVDQTRLLLSYLRVDDSAIRNSEVLNFVFVDLKNGDYPGGVNAEEFSDLGVELVDCPLVTPESMPLIDSERLAAALFSLV